MPHTGFTATGINRLGLGTEPDEQYIHAQLGMELMSIAHAFSILLFSDRFT
jgi:hypothetical protein